MDKLTFNPVTGSANVEYASDAKHTYFRIANDVTGTRSASGKSLVIASTKGNQDVNGVKVGLNVYRKA